MFQESRSGADASTVSAATPSSAPCSQPQPHADTLRHMLFGSPEAVKKAIARLHQLNYAEPNDWSKLMPTGKHNEVMSVLTRKVRVMR